MASKEKTYNHNAEFMATVDKIIVHLINQGKLSVKSVAVEMDLDIQAFRRRIKNITGKTSYAYVNEFRLAQARHMLRKNNLRSIASISSALGFDEPTHFSRSFKRVYGVTPSAYRTSATKGRSPIVGKGRKRSTPKSQNPSK